MSETTVEEPPVDTPPVDEPEPIIPLLIDKEDYYVEITIKATQRFDVSTGKSLRETKQYSVEDIYNGKDLRALIFKVEPISGP